MSDPFNSPKLRLKRAKEHIAHLNKKLILFFKKRPYSIGVDLDTDGITELHKYKFSKRIPEKCSVYAADALESLRSSLDQTGYAVATLTGVSNPRSAKFPFGDTTADVENDIKRGCKDLPREIVDLFRAFQPHKGGNKALWVMNKLRNETHTKLIPMSGITSASAFKMLNVISPPATIVNPVWDSDNNEIVFLEVGPGGKVDYHTFMSVSVSFDHPAVQVPDSAVTMLSLMANEVHAVIRATEAECVKMGLFK